ncbi:hypothetical protein [Microbacterium pumilum]|uniref:DUF3558 domain-containing protein n=1 Tax=Microbacterium pumilum TaxID=344165 RepID=A0ABN2SI22_9MICO
MARAVSGAHALRGAGAIAAVLVIAALMTSCKPEPAPGPTTSDPTPSATPSATSEPSASPTPSETPVAEFELPTQCEDLYSDDMLASLNAANPPLNDPGVTMHSTQTAAALEVLNSGIPTIRCSWGQPSEFGLATNVSVIDAAQSADLLATLREAGFACEDAWEGVNCTIEQKTVDQDDNEVTLGESHFLRGTGWVSTAWINFAPEGYTEDIVTTLWG